MADSDYDRFIIERFRLWTIYIHEHQGYLGRCYIALNREGNLDPFRDTTPREQRQLSLTLGRLRSALDELYSPDMYNYANLRNVWPRCHWHVIPRYKSSRTVHGVAFHDANWGANYAPYNRTFTVHPAVLQQIRADIQRTLAGAQPTTP